MGVDVAKEWITTAENDINISIFCKQSNYIENSCFHSQQAIEKILKAAAIFDGKEINYTHNLRELLNDLDTKWNIKTFSCDWDKISKWNIARYIRKENRVTVSDAEYGIKISQEILKLFRSQAKI